MRADADGGAGWIVGNLDMDDNYLRTICVELQIAIANVEYRCALAPVGDSIHAHGRRLIPRLPVPRLCPEHQFPAPFDDSYTALKWVRCPSPADTWPQR